MTEQYCIISDKKHPHYHASSICELPEGGLLACCFGGQPPEGSPDQVILGTRYSRNNNFWEEVKVWVDVPNRAAGNPRVFLSPSGTEIWLVVPITYGVWCGEDTYLFIKRSYDYGKSWQDLELLTAEKGLNGKNKPFIAEGLSLLPVEEVATWKPRFLRSTDMGKTWTIIKIPESEPPARIIQPSVVKLCDGTLMAYMRSQEQYIYRSYSRDEGLSWSVPEPTLLPNNNSGIEMIRLNSGNLALVYNPTNLSSNRKLINSALPINQMPGFSTWGPRTPLSISLSTDGGETWNHTLELENGKGFFSYPAVIQAADETIHITYTYKRTAIKHVTLTEDEILKHS
jgi:predicted neuraminidase